MAKQAITEEEMAKRVANMQERKANVQTAIESSLSREWQTYDEFASKVRTFLCKDLEFMEISEALDKWIDKHSTKEKSGKKVTVFSPVEWKNPHTKEVMLRLKGKLKNSEG